MIALDEVEFAENGGTMEVGEVLEDGERITVRGGGEVKAVVVTTGSPGSIRLGYEVKGRGPGAAGTANNPSHLQFVKLGLGLVEPNRLKLPGFGFGLLVSV